MGVQCYDEQEEGHTVFNHRNLLNVKVTVKKKKRKRKGQRSARIGTEYKLTTDIMDQRLKLKLNGKSF